MKMLIVGLTALLASLFNQHPLGAQQATPAPFEKKLEYVDAAATAISLLGGFDEVIVLRWQGGLPRGWVNFQKAEGAKKSDIGVEESLKRKAATARVRDPKSHSGWIIIGVKSPEKEASKIRECVVSVVIEQRFFLGKDLQKDTWGYGWSGMIPASAVGRGRGMMSEPQKSFHASSDFRTVDGKDYEFFEITLK